MDILKSIPELIQAEVISQETADKIQVYYRSKKAQSGNRLFVVFGILGALLVGLGVILILAHNWDDLSRKTKTFIAFVPLVFGQVICGFVLLKKRESVAWRESSALLLFIAIAASISLVAQIYNISGDFNKFLLTWMLLGVPLVYIMRSSATSLLYIIGVTIYSRDSFLFYHTSYSIPYLYWLLLLLIVPYYFSLFRKNPENNFVTFHNWLVPISVAITLSTIAEQYDEIMYVGYMSLFGVYYLIGNSRVFNELKPRSSSYLILGSVGTTILLLMLSFDWFWERLQQHNLQFQDIVASPEFLVSGIISLLASVLFYFQSKNKPFAIKPIAPVFIIFILTFIVGMFYREAVILVNLLILGLGVLTIRDGAKTDRLGVLNYGLLIITALVTCRFFDKDLSFVIRGILFISVGVGFFAANSWMLSRRREANV